MRRRYIGNDITRASARQAAVTTGIRKPPLPRPTHRGNLAGLKNPKTVYLQHNQGGYANPAIQRARYGSKSLNMPNVPHLTHMPRSADRILDHSALKYGSGSFARLMKIIK